MRIEKIITLASKEVLIPLKAMVRSLRATGCELPILVIPYRPEKIPLPEGCEYWEEPAFLNYIDSVGRRPVMRKYQVLLNDHYQFVDTDVIFLQSPEKALHSCEGFITSCCHWSNPGETLTPLSRNILAANDTLWPLKVFNSGQFACDRQLYTLPSFQQVVTNPDYREVILENPFHEQPGMNLLVRLSQCPITNLTLPPRCMPSTWAGDYPDKDYRRHWPDSQNTPYLIHWAGRKMDPDWPICDLFFEFLTKEEKAEYLAQLKPASKPTFSQRLRRGLRAFRNAFTQD